MPLFEVLLRRVVILGLTTALIVASACGRTPENQQTQRSGSEAPTIEQFLNIRAPGDPTLAPDGSLYVRDWPDGIVQLHVRKAGADPKAPLVKLTDYPDGLGGYSLSPDGTKILLAHAPGGNEQYQLSLLDPASGRITSLLENPDVRYGLNLWLPDSSGFVYAANDQNPADFTIYRYDFATRASTRLLAKEGDWSAVDITDDGTRMLVREFLSVSEVRPYELTIATGELKPLAMAAQPHTDLAAGYLPGEREVLMSSDIEEGISRLFVRDLETGATRKPLPELDPYELDALTMNNARTLLGIAVNRDGFSSMQLVELPSFTPVKLPEIEEGVLGTFEVRDDTLVWTFSNARVPGIAYAWRAGEPQPRQLTTADTQGIDLGAFPLPQLVRYPSFDGREIPALLFTPPGYEPGRRIPFVVNYHGGPEVQSRPGFSRETQYLLARGYGVMEPNVRGSTGYGRAYHELDNYKKRWDSVKDGVEAARWLVANGYAQAGKIAAYGGSYGGFMAVAAVAEDGASPEPVFGAAIDVVGIVNMRTFLEQTRDYRRELREAEYGPLTDVAFLESISPLNRIEQIHVPVLIAHGLNDPRVPIGEAMQLAEGLIRQGIEPEQLYFHDEGHGFAKLDNRVLFAEHMAAFLDQHIGPGPK